MKVAYMHMRR